LSVRSIVLSYNLKNLFNKKDSEQQDVHHKLTGLTITGVRFEYDSNHPYKSVEKLKLFLDAAKQRKTLELLQDEDIVHSSKNDSRFTTADLASFLPETVRIRDVYLHSVLQKQEATLRAKEIQLLKLSDESSAMSADMKGSVSVKLSSGDYCSVNFNSHSMIAENFDEVTANLFLSNIYNKDVRINSLNLLCEYSSDKKLHVKTLRNTFPFAMEINSDLNAKTVDFSFSSTDFMPFQSIVFVRPKSIIRKLARLSASVELKGSYDLNTKNVSYNSSGKVKLPNQFLAGGADVLYSVSGTQKYINVPHFAINGRDYDISYSGSYSFKNMNLSGTAAINKVQLANGNVLSSEIYFDPLPKGFMAFAPQLFLGEQSLTALQFSYIPRSDKSIDFSFEASDYSHLEAEEPGRITVSGSYLADSRYIQSSVNAENLYLDSILKDAAFALPKENGRKLESFAKALSSYIYSGDSYFSYDFETFAFNVPYSIIANTQKDRQFAVFSLNGNNNSVQISRCDLLNGSQALNLSAFAELTEDGKEVFFSTDLTFNGIPYHLGGTASSKWIDISGDYDFHTVVSVNENPGNVFEPSLSGTLHFANFPLAVKKYIFTSSLDSSFSMSKAEGFNSIISRFEVQEPSGLLRTMPHLELSGNITKYGFIVDSLMAEDTVAVANGKGSILWNINDGIFDSINMSFSADSFMSGESWKLEAGFTNPLQKYLSLESLKKDWYFSASAEIHQFLMSHILKNQSETDT
ncbi:MAG: hypothetical protein K5640_04300, partial [Treponema sp.]|nr:hypothetical protein [Treponema sp.]